MTKRKKKVPPQVKKQPLPRTRTAPWASPPDPLDDDKPRRGTGAVQHTTETRGRRSAAFPDINITATAASLGVTKSHLAKVLAGHNKPSLDLAQRIAAALGRDLTFVASLHMIRKSASGKRKTNNHRRR